MSSLENSFCRECLAEPKINGSSRYVKSSCNDNIVFNVCNDNIDANHGAIYEVVGMDSYVLIGYWFVIWLDISESILNFDKIIFFMKNSLYKDIFIDCYKRKYEYKFNFIDFMPNNTEEDIGKAIAKVENLLYLG